MNSLKLANSPVGPARYKRSKRLTFLFAGLRNRSLIARDELAEIATGGAADCDLLLSLLGSQVSIVNRRALLDLAWLLSNQKMHMHDIINAGRIYDYALEVYGLRGFSQMHKINLAIVSLQLGNAQLAQRAVAKVPGIFRLGTRFFPQTLSSIRMQVLSEATNSMFMLNRDYTVSSEFLRVDAANPFRGESMTEALRLTQTPEAAAWLKKLNGQIFGEKLAPIAFTANPQGSPLDSLTVEPGTADPGSSKLAGPKVTVVMSTFQPNEHVYVAVNSTLSQTYSNIELLVVDDCSGDAYDDILDHIAGMDPRVRVLRQTVNGGTYKIRNRAMDEATGELITFQDSDDWMHPQRIELQVADLIYHPDAVGNVSMSTRLTDRLEAVESNRRLRIGICEPALMFWRVKVRDRIGYFDDVRKGGDTEYRKRLNKAFGVDCPVVRPWRILTVQRADNGGLTQGELGFRWIAEFRTQYRDSYLYWHRAGGKAKNWYVANGKPECFAPRYSRALGAAARADQNWDVVIGANLRDRDNVAGALAAYQRFTDAGKRVAFLQLNNMYPRGLARSIAPTALDLLNTGVTDTVFARDELRCELLHIIAPSAWLTSYSAEEFDWKVGAIELLPFAAASEGWRAEGEQVDDMIRLQLEKSFGPVPLTVLSVEGEAARG